MNKLSKLNNIFRILAIGLCVAFMISCEQESKFLAKIDGKELTVSTLVGTKVACVFTNGGKTLSLNGVTYEFSEATSSSSARYKNVASDGTETTVVLAVVGSKVTFTIGDDIAIYYGEMPEEE